LKIRDKSSFDNNKYNSEKINFDKIIIPPPFLPNPDFAIDVENENNHNYINKNDKLIYDNFRFKCK